MSTRQSSSPGSSSPFLRLSASAERFIRGVIFKAGSSSRGPNVASTALLLATLVLAPVLSVLTWPRAVSADSPVVPMVAAGEANTLGLKSDGTVLAVGNNELGGSNVQSWTDIDQVDTGSHFSVGLKFDGTVVAVGDNNEGESDVGSWTGIVQVSAGAHFTIGRKADGTILAAGDNDHGERAAVSWTGMGIVEIAAGAHHVVGLKADGTVVALGDNSYGQCNVSSWTGIEQVAAGYGHTVGLKSDGTVVSAGRSDGGWPDYGQCNVGSWTDIVYVAGGFAHTVGIRSDGTVVAAGPTGGASPDYGQCNVASWTGIVQVAAGNYHTVGLKSDGTVVAAGPTGGVDPDRGQCNVGSWNLMSSCSQAATATGSGTATLCKSVGAFSSLRGIGEGTISAIGKPAFLFPHGFFEFQVTRLTHGESVTLTITLPSAVPTTASYWKYGPTPSDSSPHWYQIAMGDNDGDDVITITLTDGDWGDDDLVANGTIVDQGGPGWPGPSGGGGRSAPVYPSIYIGIGAAFGAGIVAYLLGRRLASQ
jgi:hypothetical protein